MRDGHSSTHGVKKRKEGLISNRLWWEVERCGMVEQTCRKGWGDTFRLGSGSDLTLLHTHFIIRSLFVSRVRSGFMG